MNGSAILIPLLACALDVTEPGAEESTFLANLSAITGSSQDGPTTDRVAPAVAHDEDDWAVMYEALRVLWSGTPEERLTVALDAEARFQPLLDEPEERLDELRQVAVSLSALLEIETDEWILDRLARGLVEQWSETLTPLFLDALTHPSAALRYRAAQHFAEVEAPIAVAPLMRLLRKERLPWIRVAAIEALEYNDSEEHASDCLRLMRASDPELAVAAIDTVYLLEPPGFLSALLERAAEGPAATRAAALDALSYWPRSPGVFEVALAASRSAERAPRLAGIRLLGATGVAAAMLSLVELAHPPNEIEVRIAAACSLKAADDPSAPALIDALDAGAAGTEGPACGGGLEPPSFVIAPPAGSASVVCRAGPTPADAEEEKKPAPLAAGTPVTIEDHFALDDDHWVAVSADGDRRCWLPRDEVVP